MKQEIELIKQEMELFLLLPGFQSKNFFKNIYSTSYKDSNTGFETGNRINKTGNGIISPTSSIPIKKLL